MDINFSLQSNDKFKDPWPIYEKFRGLDRTNNLWSKEDKCYFAFTYDKVQKILLSPEIGADYPFRTSRHAFGRTLLDIDSDEHSLIKKSFRKFFSSFYVKNVLDNITSTINDVLEKIPTEEFFDFSKYVSHQIPIRIIFTILGLPFEKVYWVYDHVSLLMQYVGGRDVSLGKVSLAKKELETYLNEVINTQSFLKDEKYLIAHLLNSDMPEQLITTNFVANILLLLSAATETTAISIDLLFRNLFKFRDTIDLIKSKEDATADIVREHLRFEPPLHFILRFSKDAIDLGEGIIPKNSFIQVCLASANRDQEVFPHADDFDPARKDKKKDMTFGSGSHGCLGSYLAKIELEELTKMFFYRFKDITLLKNKIPTIFGLPMRKIENLILKVYE